MISFDSFVGLPYLDRGRTRAGVDCYGLLRLVYGEQLGIELPAYSDRYMTAADDLAIARLIADELDPWEELAASEAREGDAVLMRSGRYLRHVGIVAGRARVLHIESGDLSRIERSDFGPLAHRVAGFFRYRGN